MVGDEMVYLRRGHEATLVRYPEATPPPYEAWPSLPSAVRCRVLRVTPLLPLAHEAGHLPRLWVRLRPVELPPPPPAPQLAAPAPDVDELRVGDAVEGHYGTDADELWSGLGLGLGLGLG